MAGATHAGLRVPRTHPGKAAAAETLAQSHGLPNVSDLLPMLIERYVAAVSKLIS